MICKYYCAQMTVSPKGPEASRLRQRKHAVMKRLGLEGEFLPGCLSQTHRRCGRPNCHCAADGDPGHPIWFLTFMSGGKRRVERIPAEWAESVQRQVDAGRALQDAVKDMLAASAELLVLARKQQGR